MSSPLCNDHTVAEDASKVGHRTVDPTSYGFSTGVVPATHLIKTVPPADHGAVQSLPDLPHAPGPNPAQPTLRTAGDVLPHDGAKNTESASNHSALSRAFPITAIENVIDIIECERDPFTNGRVSHKIDELWFPGWQQETSKAASLTLANVSLVHRSWTWPAQKAIGRQFALSLSDPKNARAMIRNPFCGYWTQRAYIYCETPPPYFGSISRYDNSESVELLSKLFKRLPNLRHLALSLDWHDRAADMLYRGLMSRVPLLKTLHSLAFVDTIKPPPASFFSSLNETVAKLPMLESFSMKMWMPVYRLPHILVIPSHADRPPSVREMKIFITRDTPLEFITWLFRPQHGEGASHLRSLTLRFETLFRNTYEIARFIQAVNPEETFPHLHELVLPVFRFPNIDDILRMCSSLRVLHIPLPREDVTVATLQLLPPTLEMLNLELWLAKEDMKACAATISQWINSKTFRTSHPRLRSLRLFITHVFFCLPQNRNRPPPIGYTVFTEDILRPPWEAFQNAQIIAGTLEDKVKGKEGLDTKIHWIQSVQECAGGTYIQRSQGTAALSRPTDHLPPPLLVSPPYQFIDDD